MATSNSNQVAKTGINDGNRNTNVELNDGFFDGTNKYEAVGVVWSVARNNINTVKFYNGTLNQYANGNFTANLTLQSSTDGTTWTNTSWTLSPSYSYQNNACGIWYTFTGTSLSNIKGIRVSGQVNSNASSASATV